MTATPSTVRPARTGGGWRRYRLPVGVAAAVLAGVALVALTANPTSTVTPLDPDNTGPAGTAAVVEVLGREGVQTTIVRDAAALEAIPVPAAATVVVSSTADLGASTLDRLTAHAGAGHVVLLEPRGPTWSLLGAGSTRSISAEAGLQADCDPASGLGALAIFTSDLQLRVDQATTYPGAGCFPGPDGRPVLREVDGMLVLGAAAALTNEQVLRADNAAAALRLLGGGDEVVWYVPDLRDLGGDDAVSLRSLLPRWVLPGLWLLAAAGAAALGWRIRRLGALATEELPVVVRAVETTRSRGRLYRRGGDRAHAARILRVAVADHLSARHRPGSSNRPDGDALAREVAAHTGRDSAEVRDLLDERAPAPPSDHDLVMLAQHLDQLEREAGRQ